MAEPLRMLPLHVPLQAFQGGEWVCSNGVAVVAGPRSHPLQLGMQWPAVSSHIDTPATWVHHVKRTGCQPAGFACAQVGLLGCRMT